MSQIGQTHFKNLVVNPARFLKGWDYELIEKPKNLIIINILLISRLTYLITIFAFEFSKMNFDFKIDYTVVFLFCHLFLVFGITLSQ